MMDQRYRLTQYVLNGAVYYAIWDTLLRKEVTVFPSHNTREKYMQRAIQDYVNGL